MILVTRVSEAKFGSAATLEQQVQWWKFALTESKAALARLLGSRGDATAAMCQGFHFAKEAGCPEQYWPHESAQPAPQAAPAQQPAATSTAQERFATVATQTLNLRSCPAANCEKIVEMPQGYRAKVIGDAGNGWAQLEVTYQNGRKAKGFANAKHLQF